jgi:hypothetical protein
MIKKALPVALAFLVVAMVSQAQADVRHYQVNEFNFITWVENDPWQPEGFEKVLILKASKVEAPPIIDGRGDDPAWAQAEALKVPLFYGPVKEATLKAVYTEKEIFLMVSWPDATKDDQHRPWIWNPELGRYVEGSQVEDSLLVSFESGCEWTPSLLSGYVYDFDGWRWLAARTNPIGQAVDVNGHVQDRWIPDKGFKKYKARNKKPFWNLKFTDHRPNILTKRWFELDRAYQFQPISEVVYVALEPDGYRPPAFAVRLPAPQVDPELIKPPPSLGAKPAYAAPSVPAMVPQFKPVKLEGDAGEVAAKGTWKDGRWTVEFRRILVTPARTKTDWVFERLTQFSIHIFDHTERVDESSESGRIFLQFMPAK